VLALAMAADRSVGAASALGTVTANTPSAMAMVTTSLDVRFMVLSNLLERRKEKNPNPVLGDVGLEPGDG
jgi:hypothetical protein